MTSPSTDTAGTATRILDIAEHLVQVRGFNAFSYADVASVMSVTKASLHYHFPSKAILGETLIRRYQGGFQAALTTIERSGEPAAAQICSYIAIYRNVLASGRLCLCCMLAADYMTLPKLMQDGVRRFFDLNYAWLAGVLESGRNAAELDFDGPAMEVATFMVASLEGAMVAAWVDCGGDRFAMIGDRLLASVGICPPGSPRRLTQY